MLLLVCISPLDNMSCPSNLTMYSHYIPIILLLSFVCLGWGAESSGQPHYRPSASAGGNSLPHNTPSSGTTGSRHYLSAPFSAPVTGGAAAGGSSGGGGGFGLDTQALNMLGAGMSFVAGASGESGTGDSMNSQLAKMAISTGSNFVQQNMGSWFGWLSLHSLKPYFHVDNSYVLKKIGLVLFPFTHKAWVRKPRLPYNP